MYCLYMPLCMPASEIVPFLDEFSSRWLCWTVSSADHLFDSCRSLPASFSRCLALERNSRCLTRSFPLWSWMSLTSSLKVLLNTQTHKRNTHRLTWFNLNRHSDYNMLCVFQVHSSACCVETWRRKSAPPVLKIPFSARRDSKSSAGRVHLRCCLYNCLDTQVIC